MRGGTDARFAWGEGNIDYMHEVYEVRPSRIVYKVASVGGGPFQPTAVYRSRAMIEVWFSKDVGSSPAGWREDKATRLARATFSSDGQVIAEMRGLPRPPIPPPGPVATDMPPDMPRD